MSKPVSKLKIFLFGGVFFLCLSLSSHFLFLVPTIQAALNRPTFSVKFRRDRRALNVNFYNLQNAKSVSYVLTYIGNNLEQGVVGSIYKKEGNSAYRLLLFGTCSRNVCTYHKNVRNCQLVITSKLTSGQTLIKRYKIKV